MADAKTHKSHSHRQYPLPCTSRLHHRANAMAVWSVTRICIRCRCTMRSLLQREAASSEYRPSRLRRSLKVISRRVSSMGVLIGPPYFSMPHSGSYAHVPRWNRHHEIADQTAKPGPYTCRIPVSHNTQCMCNKDFGQFAETIILLSFFSSTRTLFETILQLASLQFSASAKNLARAREQSA